MVCWCSAWRYGGFAFALSLTLYRATSTNVYPLALVAFCYAPFVLGATQAWSHDSAVFDISGSAGVCIEGHQMCSSGYSFSGAQAVASVEAPMTPTLEHFILLKLCICPTFLQHRCTAHT